MKQLYLILAALVILASSAVAQVSTQVLVKIVKAEDARAFDKTIGDLITSGDAATSIRAALAAGRIGDTAALPALETLLTSDRPADSRAMAAFAIGEIESINGAKSILAALAAPATPLTVRARAVEAAGKIAAANAKDPTAKDLGEAINTALRTESTKGVSRDRDTVLLALTAALRAKPTGVETEVAKCLRDSDPRVRADAANTLARLKAKNANETLRRIFAHDADQNARINAAKALGAAEDKDSLELLLNAISAESSSNVRIAAVRAVAGLKNTESPARLVEQGRRLLKQFQASRFSEPTEKSELLEIATALARLLPNTEDDRAVRFLNEFRMADGFSSPENEIALAKIAPRAYANMRFPDGFAYRNRKLASGYAQGLAELATVKDTLIREDAMLKLTEYIAGMKSQVRPEDRGSMLKAMPDLISALAAFKPDNIDEVLRGQLAVDDVFIRAAAAGAIADRPASKENIEALSKAFSFAFVRDKHDNDAILAVLDATSKLDKKAAAASALMALNSPDYLVRKKGFDILSDKELVKESPGIPTMVAAARTRNKDHVLVYSPALGTKLGQILNTEADYRRALSRRNGTVKAVLTTEKGSFTIDLMPEDAPLTVDNFIKLARSGYFNGLEVHRVVPNFVMQDGDPRGDGNGGPGWSIRCEVNMLPYDRGAVGMALSGKDTGGSQWFVTHSPQPHLDGGYTVFGHVSEAEMKTVDTIVRGDKITNVKIVERTITAKHRN